MHAPRRSFLLISMACWAMGTAACSSEEQAKPPPPYCNPLSVDHCMMPWPSSFYLKPDPSTKTGYRVAYPREALPKNHEDVHLDPTRYNHLDGFSIGSHPVVYFESEVLPDNLPSQHDLQSSTTDKSPIWIINYDTGERVPLFAETDCNAQGDQPQGLIIRPQNPLEYNSRYVVVLRSKLKAADGRPLEPPGPFANIRDGRQITDETLLGERERIEDVLTFLEGQQIPREELVLAWDFHTVSQEAVTSNLIEMVGEAMSRLPPSGPKFEVDKALDYSAEEEPHLLRRVEAKMIIPSFFESDDFDSFLKLDGDGKPVYRGEQAFDFWVNIPRCAEEAANLPLPVLYFGHGLFSSPRREFTLDEHKAMGDRLCMVEVTTPWRGLAEPDIASVVSTVMVDFTSLPRVTDQLQQSHVNAHSLTRMMQGSFVQDPAMLINGVPVTDGQEMYFLGFSNGGIQGVAFAALHEQIERFVFNVSGGWWSMMIQRSSNFSVFTELLERSYNSPLDRLLLVSLSQHLFDYTDPINFARHVIKDPLPGRSPKRVLMQEGKHDDQVPNLATRSIARAIGLDALSPMVEPVFQMTAKQAPLDSAYVQYKMEQPIIPDDLNHPASRPPDDQSAHHNVRNLEACLAQIEAFFQTDGQVIQTCQGPCDPE